MVKSYSSDRESGPRPRLNEVIPPNVWAAFVDTIEARIADGSFGWRYPYQCPDGGIAGADEKAVRTAIAAHIPELAEIRQNVLPNTLTIRDLLEFAHDAIAEPIRLDYHKGLRHHHLDFHVGKGQAGFRDGINLILARNGLAYEMSDSGQVVRLAPPVLRELLQQATFITGDGDLDRLLEIARSKFLDPNPDIRREAVEKIWDAWERIKTLEDPRDDKKKNSTRILLDRSASAPEFRKALEGEATALTSIGNTLMIRHTEVAREPIDDPDEVDYLFHLAFAMIHLVLRKTARLRT